MALVRHRHMNANDNLKISSQVQVFSRAVRIARASFPISYENQRMRSALQCRTLRAPTEIGGKRVHEISDPHCTSEYIFSNGNRTSESAEHLRREVQTGKWGFWIFQSKFFGCHMNMAPMRRLLALRLCYC